MTALVQSLTLVILGGVVLFQIWTVRYLGKRVDILAEVLAKIVTPPPPVDEARWQAFKDAAEIYLDTGEFPDVPPEFSEDREEGK